MWVEVGHYDVATDISTGDPVLCPTVEVFTTKTSQWHTTDPLPVPCMMMSSATITNTGYLLGGVTSGAEPTENIFYAPVVSLIRRATSHPQQSASAARPDSTSSAWKTLRDTPLVMSAAGSLGGMLLTVGGQNDEDETLTAVNVYFPATSTWIRVESGDLPEPSYVPTAVELPGNRLLVIGSRSPDGGLMNTQPSSALVIVKSDREQLPNGCGLLIQLMNFTMTLSLSAEICNCYNRTKHIIVLFPYPFYN